MVESLTGRVETDRVLKWIIIPLILIITTLIVIIPELRLSGVVGLVLLAITFGVYTNKKFQNNIIGIPDNFFQGIGYGAGLFGIFFTMMVFNSSFSIAVPTIPQAVSEFSFQNFVVGTQISAFLIIFFYPLAETGWKASIMALLMRTYGLAILPSAIITGLVFGILLHLLAYGILISESATFIVALQQINNISGLLLASTSFGVIASIFLFRTQNFIWVALAHIGINAVIVNTVLSVVQFI